MCNSFLFQSHFVNFTVNFFALILSNTITSWDNSSCSLFAATVKSSKYCPNHPVGYKSWNVCCIAVANIPGAPLGSKAFLMVHICLVYLLRIEVISVYFLQLQCG